MGLSATAGAAADVPLWSEMLVSAPATKGCQIAAALSAATRTEFATNLVASLSISGCVSLSILGCVFSVFNVFSFVC